MSKKENKHLKTRISFYRNFNRVIDDTFGLRGFFPPGVWIANIIKTFKMAHGVTSSANEKKKTVEF